MNFVAFVIKAKVFKIINIFFIIFFLKRKDSMFNIIIVRLNLEQTSEVRVR